MSYLVYLRKISRMFLKRRCSFKLVFILLGIIVIYNEFIVYHFQTLFWHDIDCQNVEDYCTKVLFIADPQIQGEHAVPAPLKYLFNWDSDRYLRQTFQAAFNFFKPQMLVYLGDLTDEGSISSKEEFHDYVRRLTYIFETPYPLPHIWVPGDNDIGGEGEMVKKEKIEQFQEIFVQPDVVTLNQIAFYKVNKIAHKLPVIPTGFNIHQADLNVVISHYPVLNSGPFFQKLKQEFYPHVMFCGHDHVSKFVKQAKTGNSRTITDELKEGDVLLYFLGGSDYIEIYVPTCSYRMGVYEMGYGAAVFDLNDKRLNYQVLSSPTRFPKIFFYLIVVTLLLLYLAMQCLKLLLNRVSDVYKYNSL